MGEDKIRDRQVHENLRGEFMRNLLIYFAAVFAVAIICARIAEL